MGKTVKLVVEGNVQGVGYRALVKQIARALKLKGFVRNLSDGTVEIGCSGEEKLIGEFKKQIDIKSKKRSPLSLHVENITEIQADEEEKFGSFDVVYGNEAQTPFEKTNIERLEIGSLILTNLAGATDQFREEAGEKLDSIAEKIDGGREENKKGFDMLAGKIDSGDKMLGEKIDSGNGILAGKTDSFRDEAGQKLSNIAEETKGFRTDTNQNFNSLDGKYGTISEELVKIDSHISELHGQLVKSNENNSVLIKELVEKLNKVIK